MSNTQYNQQELTFLFKGNINAILKGLEQIEIDNLIIEEPDLEEIFMHYYAKEVWSDGLART